MTPTHEQASKCLTSKPPRCGEATRRGKPPPTSRRRRTAARMNYGRRRVGVRSRNDLPLVAGARFAPPHFRRREGPCPLKKQNATAAKRPAPKCRPFRLTVLSQPTQQAPRCSLAQAHPGLRQDRVSQSTPSSALDFVDFDCEAARRRVPAASNVRAPETRR